MRCRPAALVAGSLTLALSGGYLGYHWMTHSPRFDIAELEVRGTLQLDQEQISDLLALGENANIFRTDMDTLEARLTASPWIAEASVSRSLPRGLEIELQEHRALAAVELDGLYLLNDKGEPFKRTQMDSEELDGLCLITGLTRELFLAAPEHSRQQLQYALRALHSYQSNSERPRLGELHLDERHGITLITYENAIAIHLGNPEREDFDDRYQTFDSAWGALDTEEHAAARAFRIADRTPSDRVTIAFAGN
jgi:cell division protein FtsQ